MSPDRVPMTRPSSGVRPIEVSTDRPPSIAVTDAPLPRWKTICLSSARGRPTNAAAASRDELVGRAVEAVSTDAVRLGQLAVDRVRVGRVARASGGTPCRRRRRAAESGKAAFAALMPCSAPGLCSGASTDSSSMLISTSGVMTVGSKKRAPPCTTRWPTATGGRSSSDGPCWAKASSITAKPAVWSGIGSSSCVLRVRGGDGCSPSRGGEEHGVLRVTRPSSPMRSTRPDASTASASMSISWYLNDDDPLLTTSTTLIGMPLPGPGSR